MKTFAWKQDGHFGLESTRFNFVTRFRDIFVREGVLSCVRKTGIDDGEILFELDSAMVRIALSPSMVIVQLEVGKQELEAFYHSMVGKALGEKFVSDSVPPPPARCDLLPTFDSDHRWIINHAWIKKFYPGQPKSKQRKLRVLVNKFVAAFASARGQTYQSAMVKLDGDEEAGYTFKYKAGSGGSVKIAVKMSKTKIIIDLTGSLIYCEYVDDVIDYLTGRIPTGTFVKIEKQKK